MPLQEFKPTTNRIEAFSDGFIVIIVTLLVLDLKVPELEHGTVAHELAKLAPKATSFVASFLVVAIFWMHHHQLFHIVQFSTRRLIWHNTIFLLFLSLVPFTAAFIGDYPQEPIAVSLYGGVLFLAAVSATLMFRYAALESDLLARLVPRADRCRTLRKYYAFTGLYLVATVLAWCGPAGVTASLSLYVLVLLLSMVPERIAHEQAMGGQLDA